MGTKDTEQEEGSDVPHWGLRQVTFYSDHVDGFVVAESGFIILIHFYCCYLWLFIIVFHIDHVSLGYVQRKHYGT